MSDAAQNQRDRALESLERRFAQAEAEVCRQQERNTKRPRGLKDKVKEDANSFTVEVATPPSSVKASKKGNFSFSGYSTTKDIEANDPTYFALCHPVDSNLLAIGDEISNGAATVDGILHELLQQGDSAQKYMQGSRSLKIDNWILLDNFVQKRNMLNGARLRAVQSHSKRSKKRMSMKQHKKSGSLKLPEKFHNFEIFKPMNEMWRSYISQLLKTTGKNQLAQCLLSADLHGAIMLVVHCKMTGLTGVNGIMIRETAETFGIIAENNKFYVVPKKLSVFVFQVDCWKITLHGDKLASRNMIS